MHVATSFMWILLHPLRGDGYQFWSGIAGSFLTSMPGRLIAGFLFYRHHNCHQNRCPRLAWHPDADGHPKCKVHHPDHPRRRFRDHRVR
ncbi:MAG: hypothetical protein ACXVHB_05980 [Solirubrobacteraceae bacterium]